MEEFRLQYPLTRASVVVDVGAFRGDFTAWCREKWGCRVLAFEPASEFYRNVARRFEKDPAVRVFPYGLGGKTETATLALRGDSTSIFLSPDPLPNSQNSTEKVLLKDPVEVFGELAIDRVDLLKVNIEGGEYTLLPRMLDADWMRRIRYLQVQYHSIGDADPSAARDVIRRRLAATHSEEWCVHGGQWESWALR